MLPNDGYEAVAVGWLQQVHHFVNDNVFEQILRLLHQSFYWLASMPPRSSSQEAQREE